MNVCVRLAGASDLPAMIALERQNPTAGHWPQQQYERFFAPAGSSATEGIAFVAELDPEPGSSPFVVGFLVAHRVDREWELQNVVVANGYRRQGVATRLIQEMIAAARARNGDVIFLEVRESNQVARALYLKLGFEETGLRNSYYSNPSEDAIICRLRI